MSHTHTEFAVDMHKAEANTHSIIAAFEGTDSLGQVCATLALALTCALWIARFPDQPIVAADEIARVQQIINFATSGIEFPLPTDAKVN